MVMMWIASKQRRAERLPAASLPEPHAAQTPPASNTSAGAGSACPSSTVHLISCHDTFSEMNTCALQRHVEMLKILHKRHPIFSKEKDTESSGA